jgi:enamine deaminase RidA (YjgF/YER057c/UK114 family)
MSQSVRYGKAVYLSGQVASDPSLGIKEQTLQVLRRIELLLADAGSDKKRLLSATIWIATMDDLLGLNEVWEQWVPSGCAPARATVQATLVSPFHRVEIAIVAAA